MTHGKNMKPSSQETRCNICSTHFDVLIASQGAFRASALKVLAQMAYKFTAVHLLPSSANNRQSSDQSSFG